MFPARLLEEVTGQELDAGSDSIAQNVDCPVAISAWCCIKTTLGHCYLGADGLRHTLHGATVIRVATGFRNIPRLNTMCDI